MSDRSFGALLVVLLVIASLTILVRGEAHKTKAKLQAQVQCAEAGGKWNGAECVGEKQP